MYHYFSSKKMVDAFVLHMRDYFSDPNQYSYIHETDFSVLGQPIDNPKNPNDPKVYLVGAAFPSTFKMYPHVILRASIAGFERRQADNIVAQINEVNQFGKLDAKSLLRGGGIRFNIQATVRTLDEVDAEELTDILCFYFENNCRMHFMKKQLFLDPPTGGTVGDENYRDTTQQKKVFRSVISVRALGEWLNETPFDDVYLKQVNVKRVYNELPQLDQIGPIYSEDLDDTVQIHTGNVVDVVELAPENSFDFSNADNSSYLSTL